MGKKEKIETLVEGGKATAAPPIGSTLGPLGVNVGEVVAEINKKTEAFKGMKVPVKIIVDTEDKSFEVEVGTPPISQLIKKELGIEKGSGEPNKLKVGNLAIEQIIKIAKMKIGSMLVNSLKNAVKCVVGSCVSMGVLVESKEPKIVLKEIDEGVYDKEINNEITEAKPEKIEKLKNDLSLIQEKYKKEIEKVEEKKPEEEKKEEEKKEEETKKEKE